MPRYLVVVITVICLMAGCERQPDLTAVNEGALYSAEIVRTTHGVAHITADDYPSLGFGEGYAAAEDHICNIAHGIVVARGERSKYHGMGDRKQHFMSDVVVRAPRFTQLPTMEWPRKPSWCLFAKWPKIESLTSPPKRQPRPILELPKTTVSR